MIGNYKKLLEYFVAGIIKTRIQNQIQLTAFSAPSSPKMFLSLAKPVGKIAGLKRLHPPF
jgi:hypothetical protein